MNNRDVNQSIKENKDAVKKLINSTLNTINSIVNQNTTFAVVYAVSERNNNEIIYVGETTDIVSRMKEHLSGSSFSKKLEISKDELKWYKIRYRRMGDDRKRKLFESYAIGALKPNYNF